MIPSAASPDHRSVKSPLTELLTADGVSRTSLNLSILPDGTFRGSVFHFGLNTWVREIASTPEDVIQKIRNKI